MNKSLFLQRTTADFFGLHVRFRVKYYVRKSPLSSAAKTIILITLLLWIPIIGIAQPYEGRRMYTQKELKGTKWVYMDEREEGEYSKWVLYFTDTEIISEHSYRNPKSKSHKEKSYTSKSPYYLAKGTVGQFDYSKVGKVKQGTYIIVGAYDKEYASQFMSQEIIMLNDQQLSLFWRVPAGNIGCSDTITWVKEIWLNTAPSAIKRRKK